MGGTESATLLFGLEGAGYARLRLIVCGAAVGGCGFRG